MWNVNWRLVGRVCRKHRPRKRRPQTTDLKNADLENTDLENADLENTDLQNTDLQNTDLENADLQNTDLAKKERRVTNTLENISLCSRAYYGRNEFKSLSSSFFSFFMCCFVSNFLKFVSNIQKWTMKGVIGQKKQLISQRRKAQIVMWL